MSSLIKSAMAKAHSPEVKKEIPAFAKEAATDVKKASAGDRSRMSASVDELTVLKKAQPFLESEFSCRVEFYSAADPARVDPKGKARFAKPGRPAVYLE